MCAPAGFGKTALLGFWAYRGRRPVAWLSHEGDNDPARFWRYVAAALDQVCEGGWWAGRGAAGGQPPPRLEAVVTGVVNALAALPDQVVLVVDDYHLSKVMGLELPAASVVPGPGVVAPITSPVIVRRTARARGRPPWGRPRVTGLR